MGFFKSDRHALWPISDAAVRSLAQQGHPGTYTCVPRGSGVRMGVDRDGDGDERHAHSDPADPTSTP